MKMKSNKKYFLVIIKKKKKKKKMAYYSIEPRDQLFVKGYGFLSFA